MYRIRGNKETNLRFSWYYILVQLKRSFPKGVISIFQKPRLCSQDAKIPVILWFGNTKSRKNFMSYLVRNSQWQCCQNKANAGSSMADHYAKICIAKWR